jgi:hypothetical protein
LDATDAVIEGSRSRALTHACSRVVISVARALLASASGLVKVGVIGTGHALEPVADRSSRGAGNTFAEIGTEECVLRAGKAAL